jgi:Acyl-CoA dehydrogenase, C-terminal domain
VIDAHERDQFERSIRATLESGTGSDIESALHELGWYEALLADAPTAVSVLYELHGELNTSSSLDAVLASVLSPDDPMAAVVLPRFGSLDPPAVREENTLVVRGIGGSAMQKAEHLVVATRSEIHTVRSDELRLCRVTGIDPASGLVEVSGTVEAGAGLSSDDRWQTCVALGQLALSHEMIGASRSMLGLARNYATERIQFGRPISSFQAVRHRLADSLVAVAAAEASVAAAWEIGSPFAASVAKAVAGRSARTVARHSQQVLAGIGFTAEHPLHGFVRRTLSLDQILGASGTMTRVIGEELLRSRALPAALRL